LAALTAVLTLSTSACLIPSRFFVQIQDTSWEGHCRCTICPGDFDPATNQCTVDPMVVKDLTPEVCAGGSVDGEQKAETRLRSDCKDQESTGVECELVVNDPNDPRPGGSQYVKPDPNEPQPTPQDPMPKGATCPTFSEDFECDIYGCDMMGVRTAQLTESEAVVDPDTSESLIRVTSPEASGTFAVRGTLNFTGGNCLTDDCPIRINAITLVPRELRFAKTDGTDVDIFNGFMFNARPLRGIFSPAAAAVSSASPGGGEFMFQQGSVRLIMSGSIDSPDGDRMGIDARNSQDVAGGVLLFDRRFMFQTTLTTDEGVVIDIDITGQVKNFAPHVVLPHVDDVECNQPGGGRVVVPALIEDVDSTGPLKRAWYVDGKVVAQNTDTLDTVLPVGSHKITLIVVDADGGVARATRDVSVVDTTPPEITLEPICLWPPNHDAYLFTAQDLAVTVKDACDPNPRIRFTGGTSSQPDNAQGDGNTTGDLNVSADAVCLRSERQGTDPAGRTYTVDLEASDAAGNTSTGEAVVLIGHDQGRPARCETQVALTPVSSVESPGCPTKTAALRIGAPDGATGAGGCSTTPGVPSGTGAAGLVLLSLLAGASWLRRERGRR
jgi:hypothetical protein